jgi:hypothetical protein
MRQVLNAKLQSGNGPMIPKVIKIDFYQAHPCTIAGKSIGIFFMFLYSSSSSELMTKSNRRSFSDGFIQRLPNLW